MMKTLYAIALVVALFLPEDAVRRLPTSQSQHLLQLSNPQSAWINRCSSDTSLNTMAYKAAFDTTTTSFVVFLGKSLNQYDYKWEIPLKEIDKSGLMLFRVDYNVSSITLNTIGAQPLVK